MNVKKTKSSKKFVLKITMSMTRWYSTLLSLSLPHAWAKEFLSERGAPLVNPDFKKRKQGAQRSDLSVVPIKCPHADSSSSTITTHAPPSSNAKATNGNIVSNSEDSTESELGSDSSSRWVE